MADYQTEMLKLELPKHENIGNMLKAYRKQKSITQKEFSKQIHVAETTLRTWEQNKNKPPYMKWKLIQELMNDDS